MDYEWDEEKDRANITKHGYGFGIIEDFDWSLAVCVDIHVIDFEERELWVGPIEFTMCAVVLVERGKASRIISLRRAVPHEIGLWKQEFYNG